MLLASVSAGVLVTLYAWGLLTDRVGERPVLAAGLAGAAGMLAVASFAVGFWPLAAALVGAGMLGSCSNAATGRAVMGWFGHAERGTALGPAPLRDRRIWRLATGGALLVAGQLSVVGYLTLFLHDRRGWSAGSAAAMLAVVQLGGAVMRVLAGRWSDRRGVRIAPMRELALTGTFLFAMTAALAEGPSALLLPVIVLTGVVSMSSNGLAFTATGEIAGRAGQGGQRHGPAEHRAVHGGGDRAGGLRRDRRAHRLGRRLRPHGDPGGGGLAAARPARPRRARRLAPWRDRPTGRPAPTVGPSAAAWWAARRGPGTAAPRGRSRPGAAAPRGAFATPAVTRWRWRPAG